ncbi:MAG: hypothetical protein AAF682_00165 [Planctomycetota bacterium]
MNPQLPPTDDGPFSIVFEALKAAEEESTPIRLMKVSLDEGSDLEEIDELRRLSESLSEPEAKTYTAS